jgi:glyoxylase-like metal-dependent hydrolase (beta-lactamase superfamily II)
MLADPVRWHGPQLAPLVSGLRLPDPADVLPLADGAVLDLAGVQLTVRHAPGHTQGSVVFSLDLGEAPGLLAGDVLFAGSVGRVDLPGGSWDAMLTSLRDVVLPLDDATVVLPGHGPATTIGRERATNPFLAEAAGSAGVPKGRGL